MSQSQAAEAVADDADNHLAEGPPADIFTLDGGSAVEDPAATDSRPGEGTALELSSGTRLEKLRRMLKAQSARLATMRQTPVVETENPAEIEDLHLGRDVRLDLLAMVTSADEAGVAPRIRSILQTLRSGRRG